MATSSSNLTTKLSRVRGLGAAHHGVSHWWLQRVTAIALIPLSLWFVRGLVTLVQSSNVANVAVWLSSPVNAIVLTLLQLALFYHLKLGLQVVIEDYIKSPVCKYGMLLANTFLCFTFATIGILSILKLHLLDVATSL